MTPEQNFGAPAECAEVEKQHEQSCHVDNIPDQSPFEVLLQRALNLGHAGLPVLPMERLGKRPNRLLGAPGKWSDAASRDEQQIRSWWETDPGSNPGITTGSGILVLDLDRRDGVNGLDSLREWEETEGVPIPDAARVRTASGGLHLYFRLEGPCPSPVGFRPAVDVRADGTVVVAPGAVRQFRDLKTREPYYREYVLEAGDLTDLPTAPEALVAAIRRDGGRFRTGGGSPSQNASSLPPTADLMRDGFRMGERDDGFHKLAWRLWRQHWPHEDLIRDVMHTVWLNSDQQHGDPYAWRQVEQKIERARQALEPQIMKERSWMTR